MNCFFFLRLQNAENCSFLERYPRFSNRIGSCVTQYLWHDLSSALKIGCCPRAELRNCWHWESNHATGLELILISMSKLNFWAFYLNIFFIRYWFSGLSVYDITFYRIRWPFHCLNLSMLFNNVNIFECIQLNLNLLLLYFYVHGKWTERHVFSVLVIQPYIVNSYYTASYVLSQFLFYKYFDISSDKIHIYYNQNLYKN